MPAATLRSEAGVESHFDDDLPDMRRCVGLDGWYVHIPWEEHRVAARLHLDDAFTGMRVVLIEADVTRGIEQILVDLTIAEVRIPADALRAAGCEELYIDILAMALRTQLLAWSGVLVDDLEDHLITVEVELSRLVRREVVLLQELHGTL